MSSLALGFAFFLGALTATADEAPWARFRGPNGDGVAKNQDLPVKFDEKSGIAWKVPIMGLGNSSPVVWNENLFLQSASDKGDQRFLLCLDSRTGKQNWSRSLPGKKSPTHFKNTLASSTPATDGESVFVSFWDGKEIILAAYSVKGEPIWHKNLGGFTSEHGAGASPILYKDLVILCNDIDKFEKGTEIPVLFPSKVLAFGKKTGNLVWEVQRESHRACYSAPFILDQPGQAPQLIITSTTAVNSYNPDNGSENWKWKWTFTAKSPLRTVCSSFAADGLLFSFAGDGGGDRQMYAVSLDGDRKNVWQNKTDFPYVPCCLTSGQHIYFVNDRGFAGCFEIKTGKQVWLERLPEASFSGSPVLVDGKVYVGSEQGDVWVFAAEPTFKLLARNTLGETIRSTPAIADGRMYMRGQHHLYCVSKKQ